MMAGWLCVSVAVVLMLLTTMDVVSTSLPAWLMRAAAMRPFEPIPTPQTTRKLVPSKAIAGASSRLPVLLDTATPVGSSTAPSTLTRET